MTTAAPSKILDTINGHRNRTPVDKRHPGEADEYDQGMLGDVAYIAEALTWAYGVAWEPTGERGPGTIRRHTEEETATEIKVPGAKYDIGVGNHHAQQAIATAGAALAACGAITDVAYQVASAGEGPRQTADITDTTTLHGLTRACGAIEWHLHQISDRATTMPTASAGIVLKQLVNADNKLRAARGPLESAMRRQDKKTEDRDLKPAPPIEPDKVCTNCELRPVRQGGTECPTCAGWRQRHNGQPRPKQRDAA